jgi:hypothetical protein
METNITLKSRLCNVKLYNDEYTPEQLDFLYKKMEVVEITSRTTELLTPDRELAERAICACCRTNEEFKRAFPDFITEMDVREDILQQILCIVDASLTDAYRHGIKLDTLRTYTNGIIEAAKSGEWTGRE